MYKSNYFLNNKHKSKLPSKVFSHLEGVGVSCQLHFEFVPHETTIAAT